jgi:hypothetical protein
MRIFPVSRFKELNMKNVWELVKNVSDLMRYFLVIGEHELPD